MLGVESIESRTEGKEMILQIGDSTVEFSNQWNEPDLDASLMVAWCDLAEGWGGTRRLLSVHVFVGANGYPLPLQEVGLNSERDHLITRQTRRES